MLVLKIGGGSEINIEAIAMDLKTLDEPVIVIHGGNQLRDELASKIGVEISRIRSVSGVDSVHSTDELIELMMMSYAGLANKRIVETFQRYGLNAIGLTGLDGALIKGKRNRGIRAMVNGKKKIVRDMSGKPTSINTELLFTLLHSGYVPVITVPILDEECRAINSENDDIVALLASEMKIDQVIFLIEEMGFLQDPEDPLSVMTELDAATIRGMMVRGGRIGRKLLSILKIIESGCENIAISDGRCEVPVLRVLSGEVCTRISP